MCCPKTTEWLYSHERSKLRHDYRTICEETACCYLRQWRECSLRISSCTNPPKLRGKKTEGPLESQDIHVRRRWSFKSWSSSQGRLDRNTREPEVVFLLSLIVREEPFPRLLRDIFSLPVILSFPSWESWVLESLLLFWMKDWRWRNTHNEVQSLSSRLVLLLLPIILLLQRVFYSKCWRYILLSLFLLLVEWKKSPCYSTAWRDERVDEKTFCKNSTIWRKRTAKKRRFHVLFPLLTAILSLILSLFLYSDAERRRLSFFPWHEKTIHFNLTLTWETMVSVSKTPKHVKGFSVIFDDVSRRWHTDNLTDKIICPTLSC